MTPGEFHPLGRVSRSLQIREEQSGFCRKAVGAPIAVGKLIPNAKAGLNHFPRSFVLRRETRLSKWGGRESVGGLKPTGCGAQSVECLDNRLFQPGGVACVSADRIFDLAKTGQQLSDNPSFLWELVEGWIDAVGSKLVPGAGAHG